MTTNFDNNNCVPFLGAKRYAPIASPSIPQSEEECIAEASYVDDLNKQDEEATATLAALDALKKEIQNEGSTAVLEKHFSRPSHLFERAIISSTGTKLLTKFQRIEDFHTVQDPLGTSNTIATDDTNVDDPLINGIPKSLYDIGVRLKRHPRTVRKYVAALLAFFSNLETEFVNDDGIIFVKKLPVFYATREKLISIKEHEFQEITNGNINSLPRASFQLDTMEYDETRQLNKSLAVSSTISMDTLSGSNPYAEVTTAPTPYNFNCRMSIATRGIDDALMLVEQIGSFFNPYYSISIIDNDAGTESECRLKLEGATFEPAEQDEYSQNVVLTEINFTLNGNLFKGSTKEYLAENIVVSYSTS